MNLSRPPVRYAASRDGHVAYQVVGEGPFDVVYIPGFTSHIDLNWEPPNLHVTERLASFCRLIYFDKRGTGMSDPVTTIPTLEERMEDVRAVMDAAGSERAAFIGFSEGGAMALLFAATYPERTRALALWGSMARTTWAPDYDFATPYDAFIESGTELLLPAMAEGSLAEVYVPSMVADPALLARARRGEQLGASPGIVSQIFLMYLDVDVRGVLPLVQAPTLILHAHGDRVVNVRHGRYLADHIPGAKFVELPGIDHLVWLTNPDPVLDEIETFLTGTPPVKVLDRALATVMFTDIVASTEHNAGLGDAAWRDLLAAHNDTTRRVIAQFRGRAVKTTGDGFLATFDGPVRAVQCAHEIVAAMRPLGLEMRVGLHAGEIEVMDEDVAGLAVHIASRVTDQAGPSEVVVSETVKGLVAGSGLRFDDRGEHALKGVPDSWRLFLSVPTT